MKVGIDISAASGSAISGVGYYIVNLVSELSKQDNSTLQLVLFYEGYGGNSFDNIKLRFSPEVLSNVQVVKIPFINTVLGTLHKFKNLFIWNYFIKKNKCDIFHGPAHTIPGRVPCTSVVTIHDLAFFNHNLYTPEFSTALKVKVSQSIEGSDGIICLSEYTKKELLQCFPSAGNAAVIYGAGNKVKQPTAEKGNNRDIAHTLARMSITSPYLLFVGDFGKRKNLPLLINSFAEYVQCYNDETSQLVLAGNSADVKDELETLTEDLGVKSRVIFTGRVSDSDLDVLYKNAQAFALSSLAEGFGMILIEAMSYGIPVVAVNSSCIEEAVGDAAILVSGEDSTEFSSAINTVFTDEKRRELMIQRGFEREAQFSWEKTAEQVFLFYQKTLN